jgi:predicted Na+-dependent transporter
MGLSLTIPMILQPLRNGRLVVMALLANFVLVPLMAYLMTVIMPLDESLQIALLIFATAAGAPFIPKLAQSAKGNIAFAVGLTVLLMVITVFYVPIVLPLLLPGVQVDPWAIAKSLVMSMLVPLSIGLLIKSQSPDTAAEYAALMTKVSSVALVMLWVFGIGLNISNVIDQIGTRGILAFLIFIVGSFVIGYLLGGRDPAIRKVMALGTCQRNVTAAVLIVGQNFAGTDTVSFVLLGWVLYILILLPLASRLGAAAAEATAPAAGAGQGG